MSERLVVALAGGVGALLLGIAWWRGRPSVPRAEAGATPGEGTRFGSGAEDRSARRAQASRLAYAVGAASIAMGASTESTTILAVAVGMLNLGTLYRYAVVALDRDALDEPLLERTGRGLLGDVADRLAEPSTA